MRHRIVEELEGLATRLNTDICAESASSHEGEDRISDRYLLALCCDATVYPEPPPTATRARRFEELPKQTRLDAAYALLHRSIHILREEVGSEEHGARFAWLMLSLCNLHTTDQHEVINATYRRHIAVRRARALRHRSLVFARDAHRCQYCGSSKDLTLDHVEPLSREGTDFPTNLTTACKSCNCRKGTKSPELVRKVLR